MKTQKAFEGSNNGWSCSVSPPSKSQGWSNFPPTHFPSEADLHFSSPKVQAWAVGNTMQLKVVKQVKAFFTAQKDESDDDDVEDEDDDVEEEEEEEDGEEHEGGLAGVYEGFFLKLFQENEELKGFYLKNYENGEFGCLVCGGVGFIRRFKDCVALVQHTVSISKTKKMMAHRAFGQVVCKVLGWDIDKLPSSVGEKKNVVSRKSKEEKVSDGADSFDKETGEKDFASAAHLPDIGALAVGEVTGDGSSIATKLKEKAPNVEQGIVEGSLDCVEVGPDNGTKCVGRDVDVGSVIESKAAETKGREATGAEMLPSTDISNLAQETHKEDGSGKNESEDYQ